MNFGVDAGLAEPRRGLTWGIKRSFIRYLAGVPDAVVSAAIGADVVEGDLFNFAPVPNNPDSFSGRCSYDFRGDVRLRAYYGMLFLQLLTPRIDINGDMAILSVATGSAQAEPASEAACTQYVQLAILTDVHTQQVGQDFLWFSNQVRLTPDGSAFFNDQYPEGQEMDPVFIRVPAEDKHES
jgi:hypothetical protein